METYGTNSNTHLKSILSVHVILDYNKVVYN